MPDSVVRGRLELSGFSEGLSLVRQWKAALVDLGGAGNQASLGVDTSSAKASLNDYNRAVQSTVAADRSLIDSQRQVAREYAATTQARQSALASERTAISERLQLIRTAAQQEIAIQKELTQQVMQATQQRQQAETRAAQTVAQQQSTTARASRLSPTGITGSTGSSIARTAIAGGSAETAIASLIAPEVTIPLAIAFAASKFIVEPLLNSIDVEKQRIAQTEVQKTLTIHYNLEFDRARSNQADVSVEQRNRLMEEAQDLQAMITGEGAGGGNKAAVAELQKQLDAVNQTLTNTAPAAKSTDALKMFGDELSDLTTDVDHHRKSVADASYQAQIWAQRAIESGADAQKTGDQFEDFTDKINRNADALKKQRDEEVRASAVDVASFQKFEIQSLADAQITAAGKSADAWKAANQVVGQIDLSKGLSSLAAQSEPLHNVISDLAELGKTDAPLSALSSLADTFKKVADQEKAANAALDGYNLTLGDTDKRIQQIDSVKKGLLDALDAAQQAKLRGNATDQQLQLIANAPAAFSQLNEARVSLVGNASTDWNGIIANLPSWLQSDLNERSAVASAGGGKQVLLSIDAQTAQAEKDLTAFEKEDRKAVIKITADTKDAIASIDALIAHMPTSIPLLITTQPGQADPTRGYGESNAPPANPAGWNQYQPLSMSQYTDIVKEGSGGKASPFEDPTVYAAVLAAAQQYGVDPRVLLAFTKRENNNATNISPSLVAANNYGGIKFANQPGATPGPAAPANEGPTPYAAFTTPADFFKALAANLSTGMYAGDYQSGNLSGVARRYVGSDEPGRVQDYAYYASQYPASASGDPTRGYGAPILKATGYGPGDVGLGSSQAPTGGDVSSTVVSDVRQRIVNEALKSVNQDKLVDYCEQFVEETVQAITGKRGATGKNEASASTAFADAKSQGLVRPANQAPQAGDIVYYPDAAGGAGHAAIYMGAGKQISTWDKGDPTGENRKIHIESISPGAQFVMVPGTQSDTTRPNNAGGSGIPGQANVPGTGVSTKSLEDLARAVAHVDEKGAALKQTLSTLTPKDFSATISQFNTLSPILDKLAHAGDTDTTTATTKIQETQDAIAKSIDLTSLWGQGLAAITNKSGDLAAIQQKIASTTAGPVSSALNAELSALSDSAQIADRINTLTQRKADLQAAAAQTATARQAQDTAESRAQTRQGWADQDVDTALANRGRVENTRFTGVSRTEEDRSRELAFQQQLQATELQNKLADLQKSQTQTGYQRTSAEQLLGSQAAGASTNQQAGVLAARLAALREQDLRQKDLNTKAIDDIQLQIRAEAKKANLDSYNLETERIAEQRKHEDILQGITDEGVANTATRQARDRAHQQDLWNIQDERTKEDAKNTARIAAIDAEITAQQALATTADANLKAAQDALAIYTQTGIDIGLAGTALDNAALKLINAAQQAAYYASVSGLSTSTGVPYSQFPHPGASHATGGYVSGGGIVGDSASGDMSTAEYVEGNYRVYPHDSPVTQRALQGTRHYAGGTVAPIRQSSDGGGISVSFNIGAINMGADEDEDTFIARVNRVTDPKLRALYREMKQSKRSHNRANGITPMGG